jgi:Uma2 family endonuclease
VAATGIRMTADELLLLPERDRRYELIAGELHELPFGDGEHGYVAGTIACRLGAFLDLSPTEGGELFAGGTGFQLARDPDTVRAPDLAYVTEERVTQALVPSYPEMAPDLVVEVVSPNDTASEIQAKVDDWLRAGARLVWVIYPAARSAMVFQSDGAVQLLHDEDSLSGASVLPGFSCRLADLF